MEVYLDRSVSTHQLWRMMIDNILGIRNGARGYYPLGIGKLQLNVTNKSLWLSSTNDSGELANSRRLAISAGFHWMMAEEYRPVVLIAKDLDQIDIDDMLKSISKADYPILLPSKLVDLWNTPMLAFVQFQEVRKAAKLSAEYNPDPALIRWHRDITQAGNLHLVLPSQGFLELPYLFRRPHEQRVRSMVTVSKFEAATAEGKREKPSAWEQMVTALIAKNGVVPKGWQPVRYGYIPPEEHYVARLEGPKLKLGKLEHPEDANPEFVITMVKKTNFSFYTNVRARSATTLYLVGSHSGIVDNFGQYLQSKLKACDGLPVFLPYSYLDIDHPVQLFSTLVQASCALKTALDYIPSNTPFYKYNQSMIENMVLVAYAVSSMMNGSKLEYLADHQTRASFIWGLND